MKQEKIFEGKAVELPKERAVFLRTKERIDSSWQLMSLLYLSGLVHAQSYSQICKQPEEPQQDSVASASPEEVPVEVLMQEPVLTQGSEHDSYVSEHAKLPLLSDRASILMELSECDSPASCLENEPIEHVRTSLPSHSKSQPFSLTQTQPLQKEETLLDDALSRHQSQQSKAEHIVGELENQLE